MAGDRRPDTTQTAMFLRILFKSLKVRKNRVFITFLSIMIGASIITALASVYFDISAKMSRELRSYGANFFVGPAASGGERSVEGAAIAKAIAMVPPDKLAGASPYIYGVVRLDLGNAVLAGVDFSGLKRLSPYWQVEGKWITVDFDEDSCMIGKSLAKKMELKVGDPVNVIRSETGFQKRLTVKGIVETGQAEDERLLAVEQPACRRPRHAEHRHRGNRYRRPGGADADATARGGRQADPQAFLFRGEDSGQDQGVDGDHRGDHPDRHHPLCHDDTDHGGFGAHP